MLLRNRNPTLHNTLRCLLNDRAGPESDALLAYLHPGITVSLERREAELLQLLRIVGQTGRS